MAQRLPTIYIRNTDDRAVENLKVSIAFWIDGLLHEDFEEHGAFNEAIFARLNGSNGTSDGNRFTGDFLAQKNRKPLSEIDEEINKAIRGDSFALPPAARPFVAIVKEDGRNITGVRVSVDFSIGGATHSDFEDIGDFNDDLVLSLNGYDGTWDGSRFTGNFLKLTSRGTETGGGRGVIVLFDILYVIGGLLGGGPRMVPPKDPK